MKHAIISKLPLFIFLLAYAYLLLEFLFSIVSLGAGFIIALQILALIVQFLIFKISRM